MNKSIISEEDFKEPNLYPQNTIDGSKPVKADLPDIIPNSIFASIPIETPSRMTNRRIKEVVGIRYDDIAQIPVIVAEVEAMLKAHEGINQTESLPTVEIENRW